MEEDEQQLEVEREEAELRMAVFHVLQRRSIFLILGAAVDKLEEVSDDEVILIVRPKETNCFIGCLLLRR